MKDTYSYKDVDKILQTVTHEIIFSVRQPEETMVDFANRIILKVRERCGLPTDALTHWALLERAS